MIDYNDNSSLESKMKMMNMINELNVNHKVGMIWIKLNNNNPINEEIIRMMVNSCNNVYDIAVDNYND